MFHCYIDSTCVNYANRLAYKYMVYSSRAETVNDPFEYLHEVQSGSSIVNRVIEIPRDKCKPKGTRAIK